MTKCPRCHSSMILEFGDIQEAFVPVWRCLGCGRELLRDPDRQAEDERVLRSITMIGGRKPERAKRK